MANQNLACFVHYLKIINTLKKKTNKQTNKQKKTLQGLNKSSYHKNKTRALLIEPSKGA